MSFKDMWNNAAQQEKKQFGELPEGTYKAKVITCKFQPAKDPTKTNCFWDLQVIEGEHKNSHIFVYRSFSKTDNSEQNQKAINRVTSDFIQLDLPVGVDVINQTMTDVVGKIIEIKLKSDGGDGMYKNFQRIVDVPTTQAQPVINDDIPY